MWYCFNIKRHIVIEIFKMNAILKRFGKVWPLTNTAKTFHRKTCVETFVEMVPGFGRHHGNTNTHLHRKKHYLALSQIFFVWEKLDHKSNSYLWRKCETCIKSNMFPTEQLRTSQHGRIPQTWLDRTICRGRTGNL